LSIILYGIFVIILLLTPFIGKEINGQRAWFEIGAFRLQPAEFAKFATALTLAKYLERPSVDLSQFKYQWRAIGIIALPVVLIMLQPDTGTAMVYSAFFLMLYREGMPQRYFVFALSFVAVSLLALGIENNLYLVGTVVVVMALLILMGKMNWQRITFFTVIGAIVIAYSYSLDYVVSKLP